MFGVWRRLWQQPALLRVQLIGQVVGYAGSLA